MTANLHTASQAAALLASGDLTSAELVEACLDRIAAREPEVQAWVHLDPASARAQAAASDTARREGRGVGPLHGIPVALKDIIDTADQPTQNGCQADLGRQPTADAACAAALRAAGAVILGKTVTTELATLTPPKTRNPHNLGHTPGGSSSGSAAAVADAMVPLALGTQTGGSVIRPASFCGIYGLKPTLGLISRRGVTLQSHTLDTVGVYGRSVEDLALIADALSAYDPADTVSYPRSQPRLKAMAESEPPVTPSFVFVATPAWDEAAEPVTKDAFGELLEALGDRVETIETPAFAGAIEAQRIVQAVENAHHYGRYLDGDRAGITDVLRERLEAGARITGREYLDALARREVAYRIVEDLCTTYGAILTPASAGPAPKGYGSTGNPVFNGLWTFMGVPCVTLPALEADGLPLGVQLVGMRRDDGRLLRTARWLDRHLAALA